jgi:hypothetical protein
MIVERTENKIILRLPKELSNFNLNKIANYLEYVEANSESNFDEESKQNWWKENQHRFIK